MDVAINKKTREAIERLVYEEFILRIKALADSDTSYAENLPSFLKYPKRVNVYWFRNHFAFDIENDHAISNHTKLHKPAFTHRFFLSEEDTYVFSAISGHYFDRDSSIDPTMARVSLGFISSGISGRGFLFSDNVFEELVNLGWRTEVFDSTGVIFGFKDIAIPANNYFNFQNIFLFYGAMDERILSHRIRWLDVMPYKLIYSNHDVVESILFSPKFLKEAVTNAGRSNFLTPNNYEHKKFESINAFIELWGSKATNETTITRFLSEPKNKFILMMQFGVKEIYSELVCAKKDFAKQSIRPDFIIKKTNNLCNIVEFKLPRLKGKVVIGNNNRRRFSSFFSEYLAQAKAYVRYFSDADHRADFFKLYGLHIEKPKVTIVVGRRYDINTQEIRELMADYVDIELISYDDLVDVVIAQLYA